MVSLIKNPAHLNFEEFKLELSKFNKKWENSTSFDIILNETDRLKFTTPLVKVKQSLQSFQAEYNGNCDRDIEKIEMKKKSAETSISKFIKQIESLIESSNSIDKISHGRGSRPLECILASISRTSLNFMQEIELLWADFSKNFPINFLAWNNEYFNDISQKIENYLLLNDFPYEGYAYHKFSNGDWYIGQWKNNLFNGKGAYYHFETETYFEGEFENHYIIKGKCKDSKGNAYLGTFKNNSKNGQGMQVYANGNIYEGSWANNLPNGEGLLLYSLGDSSSGTFSDGRLNGKGIEVYSSGDTYEGNFSDGFKSGYGIYKYSCGDYYEGEWQFNEKNGRGKLVYEGKGYYEGEFKDDKKDGFGTEYSDTTGEIYTGSFKNDAKCGHGKLSDGYTIIQGNWHMDALISEE